METTFTKIYENKLWGDNNNYYYSGSSGQGSSIEYNINNYIPFLKKFIIENNVKTIVDLGCGDFRCGNLIYNDLNILYTGYDVYKKIIEFNLQNNSSIKYNFYHLDFYNNRENIIISDLCIIKDVLQHWTHDEIYTFLDYIIESKKFKFILLINCNYQNDDNININTGQFRALSCNYLPLKKYNPIKIFEYGTKEVLLISI